VGAAVVETTETGMDGVWMQSQPPSWLVAVPGFGASRLEQHDEVDSGVGSAQQSWLEGAVNAQASSPGRTPDRRMAMTATDTSACLSIFSITDYGT